MAVGDSSIGRRHTSGAGMRSTALALLILTCLCPPSSGFSWGIFSSPSEPPPRLELGGAAADFTMSSATNARGEKLLENARSKLAGPRNCWHDAYRSLFSGCADIMADKEKQSRLAWHLSSCFQEDSGRPAFPACDEHSRMVHCRKRLTDSEGKVFLEFFLETNALCHQLQAEAFKRSTERLVNDLSRSAQSAEQKLEVIEERSAQIIQESGKVQDSLSSIQTQTEHLTEASKDAGVQISDVLERSKAIFEQSKEIASSQVELREGQSEMREKIEAGMARVEESYEHLGSEMDRLREEAVEIEREIKVVGDAMSSKMRDLQSTADDIGSVAGRLLENQMQLLDGQVKAIEGLDSLYSFQTQALQESRETVKNLAQFGQRQQEELLSKQDQIRHAHDHLIQNSRSILEAQEEFRVKQANIFTALDKLHVLHNAILVESRFIKSFFFYCCVIFLVYMLTSAKQTFSIRGPLYFGLCITLLLEIGIIKLGADDFNNQFWIMSKVFLVRSVFTGAAIIQILHSIFTYKDYDVLNHQMLQKVIEKIQALEENAGERMLSLSRDSDESVGDYSWVFEELPDEVDSKVDPDYTLPEEVGENLVAAPVHRKYNLRPRITK